MALRRRRTRRTGVVSVFLVLLSLQTVSSGPARATISCTIRTPEWQISTLDDFFTRTFVVGPKDPKRLIRIDSGGRKLWRSLDGGCSWKIVLSLDGSGPDPSAPWTVWLRTTAGVSGGYTITALTVPRSSSEIAQRYVYALVSAGASSGNFVMPIYLAVSANGGGTWRILPVSLPSIPPGDDRATDLQRLIQPADPRLAVSAGDPRTVYVYGREWDQLLVSRNAGRSWAEPSLPSSTAFVAYNRYMPSVDAIGVDPRHTTVLWAVSHQSGKDGPAGITVLRSTNRGASWKSRWHLQTDGDPTLASIQLASSGRETNILVTTAYPARILFSTNSGRSFRTIPFPKPPPQDEPGGQFQGATFDASGAGLLASMQFTIHDPQGLDAVGLNKNDCQYFHLLPGRAKWTMLPSARFRGTHVDLTSAPQTDLSAHPSLFALAWLSPDTTHGGIARYRFP